MDARLPGGDLGEVDDRSDWSGLTGLLEETGWLDGPGESSGRLGDVPAVIEGWRQQVQPPGGADEGRDVVPPPDVSDPGPPSAPHQQKWRLASGSGVWDLVASAVVDQWHAGVKVGEEGEQRGLALMLHAEGVQTHYAGALTSRAEGVLSAQLPWLEDTYSQATDKWLAGWLGVRESALPGLRAESAGPSWLWLAWSEPSVSSQAAPASGPPRCQARRRQPLHSTPFNCRRCQ
jgi:hypothetical protein